MQFFKAIYGETEIELEKKVNDFLSETHHTNIKFQFQVVNHYDSDMQRPEYDYFAFLTFGGELD